MLPFVNPSARTAVLVSNKKNKDNLLKKRVQWLGVSLLEISKRTCG
jgi:hypothetical protein